MRSLPCVVLVVCVLSCGSDDDDPPPRDSGADVPDADGDPGDAAVDADVECVIERYLGVEGCDLMGYSYPCEGRGHVPAGSPVQWRADPPHSGDHYPEYEAQWGEHEEVVPRGTWVANLEVGGVVLLHNCPSPCRQELDVLRAVIEERPDVPILMTPDPELPAGHRFAAVSWTWVWSTDTADRQELLCFVDEHQGYAPDERP